MADRERVVSTRPIQLVVAAGSLFLIAILWFGTTSELRAGTERTVAGAIRENRNRAAAFEQYVSRTLESAELVGMHLAQVHMRELAPTPAGGLPAPISDPLAANPLFAGVLIVDERGAVRGATVPAAAPASVAGHRSFQRARRDPERPIISNAALGPTIAKPMITLTRGTRKADGSFGGAVIVQLIAERLVDFDKGATARPLDLLSIISLEGISLARRSGGTVSFGQDLRGTLVMRQQNRHPNGTYLGPSVLDGRPRYFSHRRLDRYGIFVTSGLGQVDVLAEVRRRSELVHVGLIALTLAILGFAVSAILGMRRQERAALQLAAANARLREAQRIGRIGDWEFEIESGTVHWSDELCRMYGRDPRADVLTQEETLAYYPPADRQRLVEAGDRAIATGEPQEVEVQARLGDGRTSYRRVKIVAPDPAGPPARLIGIEQDVTREKEHERLREEMSHMARVEAMNAMAFTIAHELAQPLTAASNYLATARNYARRDGQGDASEVGEALELTARQIALTRDIVRRARAMVAKRVSGDARASLPDAVAEAVALVAVAGTLGRTEIVRRLAPEAGFVAADQVQVQQVLTNLIRNAAEASADADTPRVTVISRRTGDEVTVCVSDSGPGFPPTLDDPFSPFASSKEGGLGLGLAVCRAIVTSFGGRIWLEDRSAGDGATICFTLPAAPEPEAAAAAST